MDFPFDINQLFSERISILDQNLSASRRSMERPDLQAQISAVIDELGRASAKAQQLAAPITSASKLQSQNHQLYLLKDRESGGGRGAAVGFLKVGYKKLFLLDQHGVHIEAEPLCILDFYIADNLQRHGYGLELFSFMLQHKNVEPVLMAYDRPSKKFLTFLAKHYCLMQSVPQVNNFVVFEGFFLNRSAVHLRRTPLKKPDGEIKPYSLVEREVVHQEQRTLPWPFAAPQSPQRSVTSQCSHPVRVGSSPSRVPPPVAQSSPLRGSRDQIEQLPLIERYRERRSSQQGLAARSKLYSRHMDGKTAGLLDRQFSGVRPPVHPTGSLEFLNTHRKNVYSQTSLGSTHRYFDFAPGFCRDPKEIQVMNSQQSSLDGNQEPLLEVGLWNIEANFSAAQRIKQKLASRSTRPW